MSKQLMEIVLPRLAKRLHGQLRRYRSGQLGDDEFSEKFEAVLQGQYAWLARRGVPEVNAALAIHAAVLVLSGPGLRAEAAEQGIPLEIMEAQAVRAAATDISENYGLDQCDAFQMLSTDLARFGC